MSNPTPLIAEVRPARPADAPRLAILFEQLGYPDAHDGLAGRLEQLLRDPAGIVLVAVAKGSVEGAAVLHVFWPLHVARPWAVLSAIVVDEAARSRGVGTALLAAAEQAAASRNCAHIELSSSEKRTRAHAFYEAHGYIEKRKRLIKLFRT